MSKMKQPASAGTVQRAFKMGRRGFTLIELLVVIAIIALLAAILFPVFAKAREQAKKSTCLSNMHQIGLGFAQYVQDSDGTFPMDYYYNDCSPGSAKDSTGIHQWTGFIQPYIKNSQIFVCPSDLIGGQAPTNFPAGADVPKGAVSAGYAPGDQQVPRLSYTANEQILPRPRGGICLAVGQPLTVVTESSIGNTSSTILVSEFTDFLNAVSGGGPGGVQFKSHRPTDALAMNTAGTLVYDTSSAMPPPIYALNPNAGATIFKNQSTIAFGDTTTPHWMYLNAGRHSGGDAFLFADGHAKWQQPLQTLDPQHFLWGTNVWSQKGQPVVIDPVSGNPVTN